MEKREPVPDKLRALLEEEKASGEPSGDARERVLLRLAGTFALGAPSGLSSEAGPDGERIPAPRATSRPPDVIHAARLAPAARAVRAAVIFVTGAATGVGGYHVVERARHRAPVSAPLSVPSSRPEIA